MKNTPTSLFRLLELTRAQNQYGYIVAEIPKSDLSDLAQHHYLVTFIAWRLARLVTQAGGVSNTERVMEYALIHDLGELFGGDIAMPYAKANPDARTAAKKFEAENQKYLAQFFGDDQEYINQLYIEVMEATSDEALIAKIADYMELTHYKLYVHRLTKGDVSMAVEKMKANIKKLHDKKSQKALGAFVTGWIKELGSGQLPELFEEAK